MRKSPVFRFARFRDGNEVAKIVEGRLDEAERVKFFSLKEKKGKNNIRLRNNISREESFRVELDSFFFFLSV